MVVEEDGPAILTCGFIAGVANQVLSLQRSVRRVPAAGLHTYRVRIMTISGVGSCVADLANPAWIGVVQL